MGTSFNIKRSETAPDFVIGQFGCKYDELKPYVNNKGWINFDILENKKGEKYVKINTYNLNKDDDEETPFN